MPDLPPYETHVVDNQAPEFAPRDLWADDVVLRESVQREGAGAFAGRIADYGACARRSLAMCVPRKLPRGRLSRTWRWPCRATHCYAPAARSHGCSAGPGWVTHTGWHSERCRRIRPGIQ